MSAARLVGLSRLVDVDAGQHARVGIPSMAKTLGLGPVIPIIEGPITRRTGWHG